MLTKGLLDVSDNVRWTQTEKTLEKKIPKYFRIYNLKLFFYVALTENHNYSVNPDFCLPHNLVLEPGKSRLLDYDKTYSGIQRVRRKYQHHS